MAHREQIVASSGNVFADLDLPDADGMLVKAALAMQIKKAIAARKLTASAAALILKTQQPKVSDILNGKLKGFSWERLSQFLTRLDKDIEIRVKSRTPGSRARRMRVRAA